MVRYTGFMDKNASALDTVMVLSRVLFAESSVSDAVINQVLVTVLPEWNAMLIGDGHWSLARRSHRFELQRYEGVGAAAVDRVDHHVEAAMVIHVNDLESEAAAWSIGSALARSTRLSWYDGARTISIPAAAELVADNEPQQPRELWMPFKLLLVGTHQPRVTEISDAIDDASSKRIDQPDFELRARLFDRVDVDRELGSEELSVLDGRLVGGVTWGLEVEVMGMAGYAAAVSLARALSVHGTLLWRDQTGQIGEFADGAFVFDDQAAAPDGILYIRDEVSEWDLVEVVARHGGSRSNDVYGRARWEFDGEHGPVFLTLERDGVVERMASNGQFSWLREFAGGPSAVVHIEATGDQAMRRAIAVVDDLTALRRAFWLSEHGQSGYVGPV